MFDCLVVDTRLSLHEATPQILDASLSISSSSAWVCSRAIHAEAIERPKTVASQRRGMSADDIRALLCIRNTSTGLRDRRHHPDAHLHTVGIFR